MAAPGGRFALLIATGSYDLPVLGRLLSPAPDAEGLAAVLQDPHVGGFAVRKVVDGPLNAVNRAIEQFFLDRSRDDLLLLHLSCHGIKNNNGELYFAVRDTDPRLLDSTAVSGTFLHNQMRRCRARSIVLLLDCCYSGAFLPGAKGDTSVHIKDELAGHGRAVITATNRTEYAWEGNRISELDPSRSRFTEAVIDGLRTGKADLDGDGLISVQDLYDYTYEQVLARGGKQRPQMWAELEYKVAIAKAAKKIEGLGAAAAHNPPTSQPAPPGSVSRIFSSEELEAERLHAQQEIWQQTSAGQQPTLRGDVVEVRSASTVTPAVAGMISSPGYTNPETRKFLEDLKAALADHAVSYEKAADLKLADNPSQVSRLLAGGFPSRQYTIALVLLWNGNAFYWDTRWRGAAMALKRELEGTPFTPTATLKELTRELVAIEAITYGSSWSRTFRRFFTGDR
ncbi:caspase family protein [Streptomyces cyaneofuscatus]|uniref:caspase family protein n=1 Tax=Streptomyces cyaneofuscatus TaxID=66883 RepID=UPI0036DCD2F8